MNFKNYIKSLKKTKSWLIEISFAEYLLYLVVFTIFVLTILPITYSTPLSFMITAIVFGTIYIVAVLYRYKDE